MLSVFVLFKKKILIEILVHFEHFFPSFAVPERVVLFLQKNCKISERWGLHSKTRGVFREGGALCHGPPLWVARIAKLHRKVSKIEAWPPPLQVGHKVWSCKGYVWCVSCRLCSSCRLYFCSSPDFGRKFGLDLGGTISVLDLCSCQIFWNFWPPPIQNPAYATVQDLPNCPHIADFWLRQA